MPAMLRNDVGFSSQLVTNDTAPRYAPLLGVRRTLLAAILCSSCVPSGKYDALVVREAHDAAQIHQLDASLATARAATQARDAKLAELSTSLHNAQAALDETTAMNEQLRGELVRLGKDVDSVLKERGTLSKALAEAKVRLEELRRAQEAAEARATLFRSVLAQLQSFVDASQVRVESRHGRLSLLVNGDLLFEPHHAELKASGAKLLDDLARAIIAAAPAKGGRRFLVSVHVDDAPRGKRLETSLELGAQRAIAVVDRLVSLGVSPEQLVAATVGPFDPVGVGHDASAALGKHVVELSLQPSVEDAVVVPETK